MKNIRYALAAMAFAFGGSLATTALAAEEGHNEAEPTHFPIMKPLFAFASSRA